jgi:transketolase
MVETIDFLKQKAKETRRNIIEIAYKAEGPSHPGPALSSADILAALYFRIMKTDPKNPRWEDRDRFILSKGHACPVIYSVLALKGFFPQEWLYSVRRINSKLQGHPDMNKTPGIDMTSGSLGNGLSAGLGMAYYLKNKKKKSNVFVILGDGEFQEGSNLEAALTAPAMGVDNLIAIVDYNHFQSCGATDEIVPVDPLADKWKAFNWNVIEINGHNMEEIVSSLERAVQFRGRPTVIIAHTIKGKGISFMEHDNSWHQKKLTEEQYQQAIKECEEGI